MPSLEKIDDKKITTMRAAELSMDLRNSMYIVENLGEYVFGYHRTLDEIRSKDAKDETDNN